jgi:peptidoglycan/xylan/chitin deacetylase (PgdA/CDA1 family)
VTRPLVLCYHAVSATWPHLLSVPPDDLERQLESVLAAGYRPVGAEKAAEGEGRVLHVSFDDGFASVRNALPVLERLSIPATVFVCSAYAHDGGLFRIRELEKESAARPEELRTMDWAELRRLADRGIEIGAHTVSHPHLARLTSAELQRELRESKERIETEIGRPCLHLAYPYGEHSADIRRAAEAAGFAAAFGQDPRPATWSNRYQLPRVPVWRGEGPRMIAFKQSRLGRSTPMMVLRRARARLSQ